MSPRTTRLFALILLAGSGSCTSAEQSVTGPSGARCTISVTNSIETAAAAGASGTLSVDLARDCAWTASSGADWVVITSASSGQGGGTIAYRVAENPDSAPRRTTIDVNDVKAAINQAASCRYQVAPLTAGIDTAGGTIAVDVQTDASCEWTAASEAAWIRVNAGAKGNGNGAVTLAVDASSGPARSGTVRVAGQTITVTQSAVPCTYTIAPAGGTIAAAGGTVTATVSAPNHCPWTVASNAPWMTIASSAGGIGNGSVQLAIAANPGAARTATGTLATQTFTLTQEAAPCTFTIAPTTISVPSAGGEGSATVTTRGDCAWSATSAVPWITITAGASSTGSGVVRFTAAANGGDARTGGVTIGGRTVTVTQDAPCTFAIAPAAIGLPASGGDRSVTVTARVDCAWTAASNVPWITVTAGSSASGNGTVTFNVAANGGDARSGALTVAGHTVTVTQEAAPCTFAFSTASQTYDALGGYGSVGIAASRATCSWTVVSNNADWLMITDRGAGTGNGTVNFLVTPNLGPQRAGSLTVGAQTFWITQKQP